MADLESRYIFQSYISKIFIKVNTTNDDIIKINSRKLSPEGDVYELDLRTISPKLIPTEKDIEELQPEVSDTFPFKVLVTEDENGRSVLYSPTIENEVTASQNYYVPVYFERYDLDVLREINKDFEEL
jgi:hypothetical protein